MSRTSNGAYRRPGRPRRGEFAERAALYRTFAEAMCVAEYDRSPALDLALAGLARHFNSTCKDCGKPIHPEDTFCVHCTRIGSRFEGNGRRA